MSARPFRRLRYCVAASADGFIASENGLSDWINADPTFDIGGLWREFDTLIMGRRTYEVALKRYPTIGKMGKDVVVVSTTLDRKQHPDVRIVSEDVPEAVEALKAKSGMDIWLFGGGVLFRTLANAGLVDKVEISLQPIMLGGGVRLLAEGGTVRLHLDAQYALPTGTMRLVYSVW